MAGRRCPACAQGLTAGRLGPVNLELCLTCGGTWVTLATLKQVVQAPVVALERLVQTLRAQANPGVQKLLTQACPSCDRVLVPIEFPSLPGTKITTCAVCESYWLDLAALDRIVQNLKAVAARAAAPSPPPAPPAASPASPWSAGPQNSAPAPPAAEYAPQTPSGNYYGAPPPAPTAPPSAASYYGAPPPTEVTLPNSRMDTPASTRPSAARPGPSGSTRPGERPCERCGQPNGEKAPVCWACGHMFLGQIVGKCPRCNGALHRVDSDGIYVDACDGCGGVWLERGRLSALVFQSREKQQWVKGKVREIASGRIRKLNDQILCPDCGLIMFPKTIGTITQHPICTCPQCTANFLDADAIEEVLGR